jgi:hypothetical protein
VIGGISKWARSDTARIGEEREDGGERKSVVRSGETESQDPEKKRTDCQRREMNRKSGERQITDSIENDDGNLIEISVGHAKSERMKKEMSCDGGFHHDGVTRGCVRESKNESRPSDREKVNAVSWTSLVFILVFPNVIRTC